MGLDIYLHYYEDFDAWKAHEDAKEAEVSALYDREDLLEHERRGLLEEIEGCYETEDLRLKEVEVERDHPGFEDHSFKIGYWRSSYNDAGINNLLKLNIGISLHDLPTRCPRESDTGYHRAPDWEALTVAVANVRSEWALLDEVVGVTSVGYNNSEVSTPRDAVQLYREQVSAHAASSSDWSSWSSIEGSFYTKGLDVRAIVHGILGSRKVEYLVYRLSEDNLAWYNQALEIMETTCLHVLHQPHPEKYRLIWCG